MQVSIRGRETIRTVATPARGRETVPMFQPKRLLRWMFIARLCVAAAVFVAAVLVWEIAAAHATLIAALTLVATVLFTATSVWFGLERSTRHRLPTTFVYGQVLFDLALVTAVVHVTGGAQSPLAALYILVSAAASLLLPVGGGLLVAALGSLLYVSDVIVLQQDSPTVAVWIQLAVFATVALGTAYLSARVRRNNAEMEELEAQLELARLQADDILANIRSGIITVDAKGRLLFANPAAGGLLGFDSDVMIGQPILELLTSISPALSHALSRAVFHRERVTRGEAHIAVNGRKFPIGLTTTTMDSGDSRVAASATAIFQDISDNKRLEELRLRAERLEAVAELSASLAHEIRNPLASIRSAVEQIALVPRATDDDKTLGLLIVRESDRLSRLLSEFLDFARTRVARVERIDFGSITRAAAALATVHPDRKASVNVSCTVPQDPLMVEGDEDLLHRAVFNIALNAVQAAPEQGLVTIELATMSSDQMPRGVNFDHAAVALRITDNGPGIPEDLRDKVFAPFFTTKSGGTGLGLPIVHRAVEAHRGVVYVDSNGWGTRFTVLLPRWEPSNGGGEPA
ncbi:MAG: nitrogen regulation protein NR(II) [Gemmatimonadaceae bacterium]